MKEIEIVQLVFAFLAMQSHFDQVFLFAAHPNFVVESGIFVGQLDDGEERARLKVLELAWQLLARFIDERYLEILDTHG